MGGGGQETFEGDVRTFDDVQGDAGEILRKLEGSLGGSLSDIFGLGEGGPFAGAQDLFTQSLTGDLSGTPFFSNALNATLQQGDISQKAIQQNAFRQGGGRPQFGTDVLAAQDISNTRQNVADLGPNLSKDFLKLLGPILGIGVDAAKGASASFLGTQAAAQVLSPEEQAVNAAFGGQGAGGKDSAIGPAIGAAGTIAAAAISSKEYKDFIGEVDPVLDKIDALPLQKWRYKADLAPTDQSIHLGPYAEDFKEAFGVGNGATINLLDAFGVALQAIKELAAKVKELEKTHA